MSFSNGKGNKGKYFYSFPPFSTFYFTAHIFTAQRNFVQRNKRSKETCYMIYIHAHNGNVSHPLKHETFRTCLIFQQRQTAQASIAHMFNSNIIKEKMKHCSRITTTSAAAPKIEREKLSSPHVQIYCVVGLWFNNKVAPHNPVASHTQTPSLITTFRTTFHSQKNTHTQHVSSYHEKLGGSHALWLFFPLIDYHHHQAFFHDEV